LLSKAFFFVCWKVPTKVCKVLDAEMQVHMLAGQTRQRMPRQFEVLGILEDATAPPKAFGATAANDYGNPLPLPAT
jgi:hypothetical protein